MSPKHLTALKCHSRPDFKNIIRTKVDPRPDWLKSVQAEGTQPGTLDVDGEQYMYTVVKAGLAPGLPYAVGFPADTALMISEDVPEDDRPFIMGHEVREKKNKRILGLPEEQRCQASLEAEIADVRAKAPERADAYIAGRRDFFDALVTFYGQPKQAEAVTPQFIQGIQASRAHLHHIAPPPPARPIPAAK